MTKTNTIAFVRDIDGNELSIDVKLHAKKLIALQHEGINTSHIIAMSMQTQEIDFVKLIEAVYIAYRHANLDPKTALSYEDFADVYDFEMTEALQVMSAMVHRETRTKFMTEFKKATKKTKK